MSEVIHPRTDAAARARPKYMEWVRVTEWSQKIIYENVMKEERGEQPDEEAVKAAQAARSKAYDEMMEEQNALMRKKAPKAKVEVDEEVEKKTPKGKGRTRKTRRRRRTARK